jgi:octaprenyl-diphosphate synthase
MLAAAPLSVKRRAPLWRFRRAAVDISQRELSLAIVAGVRLEASKPAASLDRLTDLLRTDLAGVNALIIERMQSPVALIPQLAGHIVAAGGKRLRPMLTLAASRMCGYQPHAGTKPRHVALAAAVEFIHTATLLHDDVVDASDLRRGLATANSVWGNKPSVLVGDFLFSRAFQLMVEDGSLKVLAILSHASAVIAEGEVLQLVTSNDTTTDEEAYLAVIRAKTAQLFAAASKIGAVVCDRPETEELALETYGRNLGIAFQLVDDMLDYSADEAALGKTIGDDFREGKITLPIVLAFARCEETERPFWRRTLEELDQKAGDLEHAIQLLRKHGALRDTLERARHYGGLARSALDIFRDGPEKRALIEAVDFSVARAY